MTGGPVRTERRLQVQFLLALVGVLAVLGVGVAEVGGPVVLGVYAAAVVGLLLLGARRARRVLRPAAGPPGGGRTCTCCTSTVHDPVRVVRADVGA